MVRTLLAGSWYILRDLFKYRFSNLVGAFVEDCTHVKNAMLSATVGGDFLCLTTKTTPEPLNHRDTEAMLMNYHLILIETISNGNTESLP